MTQRLITIWLIVLIIAPVSAQEKLPRVSYRRSVAPMGPHRYRPGHWGMVGVDVINAEDTPQEILAVMYFENNRDSQFGRRVWVPPRSRRIAWYPAKMPDVVEATGKTIEARAMLLHEVNGQEFPARINGEETVASRPMQLFKEPILTGVVAGSDLTDEAYSENMVLVRVMRQTAQQSLTVGDVQEELLPPTAECWDAVRQVCMAGDQATRDPAGRSALRNWTRAGGKLWLRLDTMEEETVRLLLGDALSLHYVDKISVNDIRLLEIDQQRTTEQSYEKPVDFLRVIADDVKVHFSQDGWPVVFTRPYGAGEIVFTTMGSRAFTQPKPKGFEDPTNEPGGPKLDLVANPGMQKISTILFEPEPPPLVANEAVSPLLTEEIGYRTAPRWMVISILAAFCGGLLFVGLLLAKSARLERILWVAPITALVAAGALFALGNSSRGDIATSSALTQFMQVEPEGDEIQMSGLAAVYNKDYTEERIGANFGGVFEPDRSGIEDVTWRMVRSDLDTWSWEKVQLPPGVRLVPFESSRRMAKPIRAFAELGPDGVNGSLEIPGASGLADALLATQSHFSMAVDIDSADNTFAASADQVLAPGTYDAGTMLSEEQTRRLKIYTSMLDFGIGGDYSDEEDDQRKLTRKKYPAEPTILVWSDQFDLGFEFGRTDGERRGGTLLAIPLTFQNTPAGTRVRIPAPLLTYRTVPGPNNEGMSTVYANKTGLWQKRSRGSITTIRFQIPRSVLPFEPAKATLTMRMNAALRTVKLSTGAKDALVPLPVQNSPVGELTFELTDAAALAIDETGGLFVRMDVSEVIKEDSVSQSSEGGVTNYYEDVEDDNWRVEYVKLDMEGKVAE